MAKTGPFFTDKARAAAAEARRKRAVVKADTKNEFKVFVVRNGNCYSWEIRRFGGIEISASDQVFISLNAAQKAGMIELENRSLNA